MFGSKEMPTAETEITAGTLAALVAGVRRPAAVQAAELKVTRLRSARTSGRRISRHLPG
jgi:hypothetical protein